MDVRLLLAMALVVAAPHGTFAKTLTVADLRAAGASSREAAWDGGRWTLVLAGNRWTLRQSGGVYGNAVDGGRIDGDRFTLTSADGYAHNEDVGRLRVSVKPGTLQFVSLPPSPRNEDVARILRIRPWTRVK
jgi:hypothetical protein